MTDKQARDLIEAIQSIKTELTKIRRSLEEQNRKKSPQEQLFDMFKERENDDSV